MEFIRQNIGVVVAGAACVILAALLAMVNAKQSDRVELELGERTKVSRGLQNLSQTVTYGDKRVHVNQSLIDQDGIVIATICTCRNACRNTPGRTRTSDLRFRRQDTPQANDCPAGDLDNRPAEHSVENTVDDGPNVAEPDIDRPSAHDELDQVIAAWEHLPDTSRARILGIIEGVQASTPLPASDDLPEPSIYHEQLIRLSDVPKYIPPNAKGTRVSLPTIYRWTLRGVRGVRLECLQGPSGKATSLEAIQRFLQHLTQCSTPVSSPPVRTPRKRRQDIQQAEDFLNNELGIEPNTNE